MRGAWPLTVGLGVFQAKQHGQGDGATEGDHEFLIWEDRGAGPVAEDSEDEHPGPAEALLGDGEADEAETSSPEASATSSEDDKSASENESEDDDEGVTADEVPQPGTGPPEEQPAGRGVLLWEDHQTGPSAREVQTSAHTYPLLVSFWHTTYV